MPSPALTWRDITGWSESILPSIRCNLGSTLHGHNRAIFNLCFTSPSRPGHELKGAPQQVKM
ncbi:unnamed protein product [Prunus armeniaca]|uniref:Uncharacterized protein n=1 Tax=Prunus armeniaca TaxID=36596 RepID=A0A6J5TPZ3_PRUAR|nr:unnamed protein product [Prunus armeniaca]CAB4296253.1 unnamed protein product [Prunus armeniaca]